MGCCRHRMSGGCSRGVYQGVTARRPWNPPGIYQSHFGSCSGQWLTHLHCKPVPYSVWPSLPKLNSGPSYPPPPHPPSSPDLPCLPPSSEWHVPWYPVIFCWAVRQWVPHRSAQTYQSWWVWSGWFLGSQCPSTSHTKLSAFREAQLPPILWPLTVLG